MKRPGMKVVSAPPPFSFDLSHRSSSNCKADVTRFMFALCFDRVVLSNRVDGIVIAHLNTQRNAIKMLHDRMLVLLDYIKAIQGESPVSLSCGPELRTI